MFLSYSNRIAVLALSSIAILLAGCGTSGVSVRQGTTIEPSERNYVSRDAALIVHVDTNERIATIRRGFNLGQSFLISQTTTGKETGILKGRARSEGESLMTADILEGRPRINNIVVPASPERTKQLNLIYPEAEPDS